MNTIDTVVIGAGHAGLAVSRLLTEAGREHVVLDRGRVAERWRTQRWDSLHLLSPNWMNRLPGRYQSDCGRRDPDGFMSAGQFVDAPGTLRGVLRRPGRRRYDGAGAQPGGIRAVSARHRPWHLACSQRGHRDRPARDAARARRPRNGAGAHVQQLPEPRSAATRRRARGRRLGVGRADRRRAQPGGPRGDPRRRTAHPDATPVPGHGHLLVAAENRPTCAHHPRGLRPGGGPSGAVDAAGRPTGRPRGTNATSTW